MEAFQRWNNLEARSEAGTKALAELVASRRVSQPVCVSICYDHDDNLDAGEGLDRIEGMVFWFHWPAREEVEAKHQQLAGRPLRDAEYDIMTVGGENVVSATPH